MVQTTTDLATLYPALLRRARRYDAAEAEDLVQDTMLRMLPDRLGYPAGYYYAALRAVAVDHHRHRARRPEAWLAPTVAAPERDHAAREALAETLTRLAAERHGPLLLAFARGATLRELAEAEGVGVATIKTRIFRTRAVLGPCPLDD